MAQKKQQRTFIKWYQPCEEFDILCSFPFTWVCDKKKSWVHKHWRLYNVSLNSKNAVLHQIVRQFINRQSIQHLSVVSVTFNGKHIKYNDTVDKILCKSVQERVTLE